MPGTQHSTAVIHIRCIHSYVCMLHTIGLLYLLTFGLVSVLCWYLRLVLRYFVQHCSLPALSCRSCVLCLWTESSRLWWPSWWAVRQQCSPQATEGQNGASHSEPSRHPNHWPHLHPLIGWQAFPVSRLCHPMTKAIKVPLLCIQSLSHSIDPKAQQLIVHDSRS